MEIELSNIRDHWDKLVIELIRLNARDSKRGIPDWRPEDVYGACLYGFAKLYVCDDGYLVFKKDNDEFVIWFAISTSPEKQLIAKYYDDICSVAKTTGAKAIAFYTSRKGFDRKVDNGVLPGFQFQYSKYVKGI